jgi:stearoyl-CoA desaturase (delta-9 desaturase)
MSTALHLRADERSRWLPSTAFLLLQFSPLLIFFTGISLKSVVLCVVLYVTRMWFITAGYHRYFSHRAFTTNRVFQFVLAFGGSAAAQKGVLWWAGHHRAHHRYTETEKDPHTPLKGLWHSHIGWIVTERWSPTDFDAIADFAKFPELRWLNRHDWIAPWTFGVAAFLIDGWRGLVVGFFLSTVLLWHATFCVNSLAHIMGRRRYATADTSRNSVFVALITGGEGWHNNHHHYQGSARQGFKWYEIDTTYYVLWVMSKLRLVSGLRKPPKRVLESHLVRNGAADIGMFHKHWDRAVRVLQSAGTATGEMATEQKQKLEELLAATKAKVEEIARRPAPDAA